MFYSKVLLMLNPVIYLTVLTKEDGYDEYIEL